MYRTYCDENTREIFEPKIEAVFASLAEARRFFFLAGQSTSPCSVSCGEFWALDCLLTLECVLNLFPFEEEELESDALCALVGGLTH